MIILKSFLRKNTTKNYFIAFFIILFIFVCLLISKNYFIRLNNENYENSYVVIKYSSNKKEEILSNKDFQKVSIALTIEDEFIIIGSDTITEDNVLYVPERNQDLINETVEIEGINFVIKGTLEKDYPNIIATSTNTINTLLNNKEELTYVIDLKNWANHDKVLSELEEDYDDVYSYLNPKEDFNYKPIISAFNIFIILNILVLFIVLVISCFNIVEDEKKINRLYKYIGFTKQKVRIIILIKISFLILTNFIICLILYLFLALLFLH